MIRKAFFWTFLAQGVSFVILFTGSVVVARLLSPREMGIFAVSSATIGILQIIATFGVGNYVIRALELDRAMLDTAFTVNAILGLCLGVAIFGLSYAGADFLGEPAVATVMRLLAFVPLISVLDFRPSTMLQREMQFKRLSAITTTQALVSTATTITAAYAGASYLSPAFGALASTIFGVISLSMAGHQHVAVRVSTRGWKPMAAFGMRMMSIGGVSALTARLSDVILGRLLGLEALGLFGRANNLSMMIFQNFYGTATRVLFAKMSADHRERGQLRETYLKGLRLIAAVMGPILLGLAVLSLPVMYLLYGEKWLGAALPLSLLMIAQFITLRYAMNWELFVIKDELRVQTRIEFTRAAAGLITRTIGSLYSIVGVAAMAIVDGLFAIALYGRHINRLVDTTERQMMSLSAEAVLLAGAATLPAFGLMMWSGWDPRTPLPLVAVSILLGAALWLATLQWRRHPLIDEMRTGLRTVGRRVAGLRGGAAAEHLGGGRPD